MPARRGHRATHSFLALISHLAPRTVTEFSYRFSSLTSAHVVCAFYLGARTLAARDAELAELLAALRGDGMRARDLGEDEMAKSHARYLVGGRKRVPDERLFRFEFPERPGALTKFLKGLHAGWNVSLFHYRNQGGGAWSRLPLDVGCIDDDPHRPRQGPGRHPGPGGRRARL